MKPSVQSRPLIRSATILRCQAQTLRALWSRNRRHQLVAKRRTTVMSQTTPQLEAEKAKSNSREHWNKTGQAYSRWIVEGRLMQGLFEKFANTLAQRLGGAGPVQVLDVAAASGEPALTIAQALPQARVISTDLAEAFQQLGRERAAAAGVAERVELGTADAEDLAGFEDGSMDVVTCSLGLMLMPAYPAALSEFHRVLKPGGLLAVTVWHSLPRIPFMHILRDFTAELDPEAAQAPSAASRFGDTAEELLQALAQAGFQQVGREDLEVTFVLPAEVWWEAMQQMPFPLRGALAKLREEGGAQALEDARGRLLKKLESRGYANPDGSIEVGGNMCHFITAVK